MYGPLWRILPGPTWAKLLQVLVLIVAAIAFCFLWLFPRINPYLPFSQNTVDSAATAPAATETTMDHAAGDEHGMPVDMASVTADELIGIEVRNSDGEKLGDITDAMLSEDGAVGGVAVSFGGFLGFGENTVELMPDEIQLMRDEGDTLYAVTSLQPDDLKNRPEIKDD